MGFVKVSDVMTREDVIINTDSICKIERFGDNYYSVYFSFGGPKSTYTYDEENAKKIFAEIGVSL